MLISDWSSDVCSSDLRLDHAFVEHLRLTGIEDPAHCEKMLERFLLQAAHHLVGLVARLGDLLPIAMFALDRLRESDIGSAHLKPERSAAASETGFDPFELGFLPRGKVAFPVEQGVPFGVV